MRRGAVSVEQSATAPCARGVCSGGFLLTTAAHRFQRYFFGRARSEARPAGVGSGWVLSFRLRRARATGEFTAQVRWRAGGSAGVDVCGGELKVAISRRRNLNSGAE